MNREKSMSFQVNVKNVLHLWIDAVGVLRYSALNTSLENIFNFPLLP